ncbi:MAG: hypothetical protein WC781_02685 [Candidatus Pacearchaeota archaeon]|jgi:hypothetical protein
MSKKGQVTIFIIFAVIIIAAGILIYTFRDKIFTGTTAPETNEVYQYFDDCIKQKTLEGLRIAGSQGGYIEVPEFKPGSEYAPFSSQLDFLGNPVPYWYYVSGNNLVEEQVPSKTEIETQLANYLNEEVAKCNFNEFVSRGYTVKTGDAETSVTIFDGSVRVNVNENIGVAKGNVSSSKSSYEVEVDSKFGKFYSTARDIYDKELSDAFLENYSVDALYNYAPVTGTELSCAPKIWKAQDVANDIKLGLSANIAAIKLEGNYYNLNDKDNKYFVVDGLKTEDSVNFMYNSDWPTRIEVWPADNNLLIAEPVGLEQGMGIIGFCYVPYHYVYDVYYPVLVQIYDGRELFQFPVSVVLDKNVPRKAINGQALDNQDNIEQICNYKNTQMDVYTYDLKTLAPVEADVSYNCFNTKCNIGTTKLSGQDAKLTTEFPQCINGKVTATAEGYITQENIISTNEAGVVNIPMDKSYDINVRVIINGIEFTGGENDIAIINFESDKNKFTLVYPQQKQIKLSEGYYNISMQVFSGASLTIPSSTSRQCVSVLDSGIMGFFGKTSEKCFDITIPGETLTNALTAGGKTSEYLLEDNIKSATSLDISVGSLPNPSSLDQLQQNYELINNKILGVTLR